MAENITEGSRDQIYDGETRDGYDAPLTGMDSGMFHAIHILALCCIGLSLISVISVLVSSFKVRTAGKFFSGPKSDRFVIYLCVCDGLFNVAHSIDHLHILITLDHVYPKELCTFYGFWNIEFISAQNLLVSVIAVNAFLLTYVRVDIQFGKCDWKLLTLIFGVPLVNGIIAASTESLGPNGVSCFFDSVKGRIAFICLASGPLILIFVVNVILYSLTSYKLYSEATRIKKTLGSQTALSTASKKATRNMSLFVLAFFVQWWAVTVYGIWSLTLSEPPNDATMALMAVSFSNTGGILNGIIYLILRRRKLFENRHKTNNGDRYSTPRTTPGRERKTEGGRGLDISGRKMKEFSTEETDGNGFTDIQGIENTPSSNTWM